MQALDFIKQLDDSSVTLFVIDPPYYGIVDEAWDNQWASQDNYVAWLNTILASMRDKLLPNGSIILFGGIGKHNSHPFFKVICELEQHYTFRNWITWSKRRAYGKSHDYLYTREEFVWFSKSAERTSVVFNIPLTDEKRGYAGFNAKYPAKSEFKRVTNVWTDIPELMRPRRACEKPVKLYSRIVSTHSNAGDLVVDPMQGTGNCGVAARALDRLYAGNDIDESI